MKQESKVIFVFSWFKGIEVYAKKKNFFRANFIQFSNFSCYGSIWEMEGFCSFPEEDWPMHCFGGKADNLRELKKAKFRVPPFFAISSEYSKVEVVHRKVELLRCSLVAVRSSGLEEDGVETAMAGANLSVLNVKCEDVWNAVERVRASSKVEAQIPVIVQTQITARCSGVAFSRDPVTGENHVVINAARGLGEAVVGGLVTPFTMRFERSNSTLLHSEGPAVLFDSLMLIKQVLAIESAFGFPVDVEWCVDETDGSFWILQARPITAIHHLVANSLPEGCLFANDHTKEVMGGVLTPLTFSAFRIVIDSAMRARCRRLKLEPYGEDESTTN